MDPKLIRAWGQIGVSVLSFSALTVIIVFAFRNGDVAVQQLVAGAVIGYAGACATFFVGSSASSQSKDETISSSYPPGVEPPHPSV